MQKVYKVKANDLDDRFLTELKATFRDQEIEIIVSEIDETSYLLKSPANREKLLKAVDNFKKRENMVEFNSDDLTLEEKSSLKHQPLKILTHGLLRIKSSKEKLLS
ncbi:MAG: hypothetical protein WAN66_27360 [Limnoraphis robusta]